MKKTINTICGLLLAGTLAFSVVSCVNEDMVPTQEEIIFDIKVINGLSPDTKAVKTKWEKGDKIFIYFESDAKKSNKNYVTMTYNGKSSSLSEWSAVFATADGASITNLKTSGKMYAVFFPFDGVSQINVDIQKLESSRRLRSKTGHTKSELDKQMVYSYYLTDVTGTSTYTKSSTYSGVNTIKGTITMTLPDDFVYFYIDAKDGKFNQNEKYRLSIEGVKPATIDQWAQGYGFVYNETNPGDPLWGYKYGNGIVFSGKIDETWANPTNEHRFIFYSDGDTPITKTFKGKTLKSHDSVKLQIENPDDGVAWTPIE